MLRKVPKIFQLFVNNFSYYQLPLKNNHLMQQYITTYRFFSNGSPCTTMYMMLASFTEVGQMLCVGISSCASGITQFLKEACEQLMIWHLDENCGK